VRIVQGRLDDARAWARERRVTPTDPPAYLAEYDQLTFARLLVAEGEGREALGLLGRVLNAAQAAGRGGGLVEAALVRALAYHANGDADPAAADLAAALTHGVPARPAGAAPVVGVEPEETFGRQDTCSALLRAAVAAWRVISRTCPGTGA
jgi:MalT-like TPR region